MYAAAARARGHDAADTHAFEDSGTGARAAREAGLALIAVPTPGAPVPAAELVLDSLLDPGLAAWIATWWPGGAARHGAPTAAAARPAGGRTCHPGWPPLADSAVTAAHECLGRRCP